MVTGDKMKITRRQLRRIIRESIIEEGIIGKTGEKIIVDKIVRLINEYMSTYVARNWYDDDENVQTIHNILDAVRAKLR